MKKMKQCGFCSHSNFYQTIIFVLIFFCLLFFVITVTACGTWIESGSQCQSCVINYVFIIKSGYFASKMNIFNFLFPSSFCRFTFSIRLLLCRYLFFTSLFWKVIKYFSRIFFSKLLHAKKSILSKSIFSLWNTKRKLRNFWLLKKILITWWNHKCET